MKGQNRRYWWGKEIGAWKKTTEDAGLITSPVRMNDMIPKFGELLAKEDRQRFRSSKKKGGRGKGGKEFGWDGREKKPIAESGVSTAKGKGSSKLLNSAGKEEGLTKSI